MTPRAHRLSNGVRVICDPMPGLETLALSVVVDGGARFEPPERAGWSHLLEHMVFKGAGERSARDIVETVEGAGAHINAATGFERTSFQIRALEGGLGLAMEVLSDLVLHPIIAADELEREKDVVVQEIAEAFDTPDDHVFELAQAKAFAGQALGRPILGDEASVRAADAVALEAWRAALYAPERLAVSAAGAVDESELLALAERLFGGAPATAPAPKPEAGRFVGGHAGLARRIEQANLVWQLPAPGVRDEAWYALRLFAEILGGGMASRLFQEARERHGLAYSIDAFADTFDDVGALGVYAGAQPDKAADLARIVAEQILALAERVEDGELARAKAQLKSALFMAREQPLARAEHAATQTFLFGAPLEPAIMREAVDRVERVDLAELAARLLAPGLAASAVLGPRSALKAGPAFEAALFG
jgi:predicted Zn-dependent peptidase